MDADSPKNTPPTLERARRKKRFDRLVLILLALGLPLLIAIQKKLLNLGPELSSNQGVITLVSINFSVLVLGLLLFLILRGLYRVFFEHRDYGSLQTKMVVSFIGLSLLPTLMIFYFAYLLIGQDHDTWFGSSIKETMSESLALAETSLEMDRRQLISFGEGIIIYLLAQDWDWSQPEGAIQDFLANNPARRHLKALELYDPTGQPLLRVGDQPEGSPWPVARLCGSERPPCRPDPTETGPISPGQAGRGLAWPLWRDQKLLGFLVLYSLRGDFLLAQFEDVRQGLAKYQLAMGIRRPFRASQLTSLAGVTLLAVFLSIWIGSHLANSLASPITELVEGTRRVARGEMDFILTPTYRSGEMAHLVTAFNQMTQELKASYSEIDSRRRFVETVLKEVSTGVVVVDTQRRVATINQAALGMLRLKMAETLGQLPPLVADLLGPVGSPLPRERVYVETEEKTLSLMVSRQDLREEDGQPMGTLLTFDDLSELEKAQRLAAWREVARRIAHEVKNPLTPISLAAQRLSRRFGARLSDEDGKIFQECSEVIIRQVENMRSLVDEFSQFARLPQINPRPADLAKVVEGSLALFRQAHPGLSLRLEIKKPVGEFVFDPEQIGRVIANLLLNSTKATGGQGQVEITIDQDDLGGARLVVADDGPGLPPEVRDRVFEPYVSQGQGGQGLGLAIVKAIISDHGGFIRVGDRQPQGTIFTIHLPLVKP
ncbi:MAG: HAMP domain-containing protein [Deltaproteobacteria bacterium]|jgi:two-component system nitrogen regulation sensor histidine kinase NtrY|nr:HAMP domain-containing protein [Deltaproteobacteria bacterium]